MQTVEQNETKEDRSQPSTEPPPSASRLASLADRILVYAQAAKVQRFRYCRRPIAPQSPHPSLLAAIAALETDLDATSAQRTCQTHATELLRELASLGHQPPCRNKTEEQFAAKIVNTALLELR